MANQNKTLRTTKDPIKFIESNTSGQKRVDCLELLKIFESSTGKPPVMWGASIIGFGTYSYKYASGREGQWMAAGFSPRAKNITLYIMSGFDEYAAGIDYNPKPLLEKLGDYSTGKSCLYIKSLADVDLATLKKLITLSYKTIIGNHKS